MVPWRRVIWAKSLSQVVRECIGLVMEYGGLPKPDRVALDEERAELELTPTEYSAHVLREHAREL